MTDYKEYHDTYVGYDNVTYDARAQLSYDDEEKRIKVEQYEYCDGNGNWNDLCEERKDLENYLNENYEWNQL
jgi:hypothetical protein